MVEQAIALGCVLLCLAFVESAEAKGLPNPYEHKDQCERTESGP